MRRTGGLFGNNSFRNGGAGVNNGARKISLGQSTLLEGVRVTNSSGFLVFDGQEVQMRLDEKEMLKQKLIDKYELRKINYGSDNGAKIITVLAIAVAWIFILGLLVVPILNSGATGGSIMRILVVIPLLFLVTGFGIYMYSRKVKDKAEMYDALVAGITEFYDYKVTSKNFIRSRNRNSYYIYFAGGCMRVGSGFYNRISVGGTVRCAVVTGEKSMFLLIVNAVNGGNVTPSGIVLPFEFNGGKDQ